MDKFLNLFPAWFRLIIILFWVNTLFWNYLFLKKQTNKKNKTKKTAGECLWSVYEAGNDEYYSSEALRSNL